MHMSDGVIGTDALGVALLAGGFVFAAAGVAVSSRRLDPADVPRIGLIAAWVFVASSIALPLGVVPVHLGFCGLAGFFLRRRVFLAIVPALILQLLLLGEGGWTTLGLNATATGLGGICGWAFANGPSRLPLAARAFAAGFCGVAGGAALVAAVLALAGYPLKVLAFFGAYLAVAVVEGIVTAVAIGAVAHRREMTK